MQKIKLYFLVLLLPMLFSGCFGSFFNIYDSEFESEIREDLESSGTDASPEYILKNLHNIHEISYPTLEYKDGRFYKKEEDN
ncbi:MAG: hypothetical protein ACPGUI_00355 [Halarcobacter sp.]